jgi:hypothetical protein
MSSLSQIRHEVETKVIRHRGPSGTWQRTVTFYPKDGYLGSAKYRLLGYRIAPS